MIAIVNYGLGNVRSILNMLRRLGLEAVVTSDSAELAKADRIILPGVGAFDSAIEMLDGSGLRPTLDSLVASGRPVLGICLGMQLLGVDSEEGDRPGLGWIPARTKLIQVSDDSPLPHMGWNWVEAVGESGLVAAGDQRFYFLHSYAVSCESDDVAATASYGGTEFTCAITHENVMGVQFHPEKSHKYGMRLFRDFASRS